MFILIYIYIDLLLFNKANFTNGKKKNGTNK